MMESGSAWVPIRCDSSRGVRTCACVSARVQPCVARAAGEKVDPLARRTIESWLEGHDRQAPFGRVVLHRLRKDVRVHVRHEPAERLVLDAGVSLDRRAVVIGDTCIRLAGRPCCTHSPTPFWNRAQRESCSQRGRCNHETPAIDPLRHSPEYAWLV
jgi:hypothetical protein